MHSITAITTNSKLHSKGYPKIGATYRQVGITCPASCIFNPVHKGLSLAEIVAQWGEGVQAEQVGECYADKSWTGIHSRASAKLEATNWAKLAGLGLIRVNVSGDILDRDGQLDIAYLHDLAVMASVNPGSRYWLYTHAWRELHASDVILPANIEVLASVNSASEYSEAKSLGYRTARATSDASSLNRGEVVCPEQTGKAPSCVACGLCPARKGVRGTKRNFVDLAVRPDIVFILH